MSDFLPSPEQEEENRSGFEPELGGFFARRARTLWF
jgi:ferredoxin